MKNLRQLLSRSGTSSQQRRGRSENIGRSKVSRRRLSNEALERRELLAGDLLASSHNYWHPYDVNDDGQYSARDALAVINYLNSQHAEGELSSQQKPEMFYDVNADNQVSASDALSVINALSRGEGVGELTELLLTAHTVDDQPIALDGTGDVNVEVNQPFDLEVSYNELRLFDDRLGVFQLFTDISVSQPNVLEPILNETQRLIFGGEVRLDENV
ncbi:MAG: dockerin type I domain-containing protein, partial [Pirellulales bacterium]|nr:dockerin type I domain-containing protein [Pirellulales bacterium]